MMRYAFSSFPSKGQNAVAGSAAIEFAIIAPVLVLALICTADLGLGIHRKMQVENAAQAGVEYAVVYGFTTRSISNAVAAPPPPELPTRTVAQHVPEVLLQVSM